VPPCHACGRPWLLVTTANRWTCVGWLVWVTATVKQLNRQLAEDLELLDREIERNSPKQLPARHRYTAGTGAPVYRRR